MAACASARWSCSWPGRTARAPSRKSSRCGSWSCGAGRWCSALRRILRLPKRYGRAPSISSRMTRSCRSCCGVWSRSTARRPLSSPRAPGTRSRLRTVALAVASPATSSCSTSCASISRGTPGARSRRRRWRRLRRWSWRCPTRATRRASSCATCGRWRTLRLATRTASTQTTTPPGCCLRPMMTTLTTTSSSRTRTPSGCSSGRRLPGVTCATVTRGRWRTRRSAMAGSVSAPWLLPCEPIPSGCSAPRCCASGRTGR